MKQKFFVQHESRECNCGLQESACDSKQNWNHDECWCECDWSSCKNYYM